MKTIGFDIGIVIALVFLALVTGIVIGQNEDKMCYFENKTITIYNIHKSTTFTLPSVITDKYQIIEIPRNKEALIDAFERNETYEVGMRNNEIVIIYRKL